MIPLGPIILVTIIICFILFFFSSPKIELLDNYVYVPDYYPSTHTGYPFWNTQIGTTRNMSYDLRGDVPIANQGWFPFNMGTTIPIQNPQAI